MCSIEKDGKYQIMIMFWLWEADEKEGGNRWQKGDAHYILSCLCPMMKIALKCSLHKYPAALKGSSIKTLHVFVVFECVKGVNQCSEGHIIFVVFNKFSSHTGCKNLTAQVVQWQAAIWPWGSRANCLVVFSSSLEWSLHFGCDKMDIGPCTRGKWFLLPGKEVVNGK